MKIILVATEIGSIFISKFVFYCLHATRKCENNTSLLNINNNWQVNRSGSMTEESLLSPYRHSALTTEIIIIQLSQSMIVITVMFYTLFLTQPLPCYYS